MSSSQGYPLDGNNKNTLYFILTKNTPGVHHKNEVTNTNLSHYYEEISITKLLDYTKLSYQGVYKCGLYKEFINFLQLR